MSHENIVPIEKEMYQNFTENQQAEVLKKVPFKMLLNELERRYQERDNFFENVKSQIGIVGETK